ncbi:MAG: hypothetical protein CVV27_16385 [Candidatus Melainabacteria bacterium HGW-Melainabacteria-1]|nr:MAG: hypothetical protein CVV27_16385 [Candidatus Melainabacteria bacterium HGW-Melainabacteria-1]
MVHRSEILHDTHFGRHYLRHEPTGELTPYVSHVWKLTGYDLIPQGVAEHYLPRLEADLVFAFANRCLYRSAGRDLLAFSGPHVLPPQAKALACLHPASRAVLGVSFRPGGQTALLGPSAEIQALPRLAALETELSHLSDFHSQAHRIESWLGERMRQTTVQPQLLTQALSCFNQGDSVAEAADAVGLSPRSLQRHCQQWLGLSPRTCRRVLRLRATLTRLWREPGYGLHDSGYHDYAHFFREFRSLTGLSPSAYLSQFEPAVPSGA